MAEADPDPRRPTGWATVDPRMWAAPPKKRGIERLGHRAWRILGALSIPTLVVGGPLAILVTFITTYDLVGPTLFGPAILLVWALLIVGFVFVVEKTGYARNFEHWHFPLGKRLLALVIALGAYLTLVLFLIYLVK